MTDNEKIALVVFFSALLAGLFLWQVSLSGDVQDLKRANCRQSGGFLNEYGQCQPCERLQQ